MTATLTRKDSALTGVKPVAWRFRGFGETNWYVSFTDKSHLAGVCEVEPLYSEASLLAERERAERAERERDVLEKDALRYRWLRNRKGGLSNRWPSVTQYPHQPEIDDFQPPQIIRNLEFKGEYLDEAIDAALVVDGWHLLDTPNITRLRDDQEAANAREAGA